MLKFIQNVSLAMLLLCVIYPGMVQAQSTPFQKPNGQKILVFSVSPDMGSILHRSNPIWTSLEREGVVLIFAKNSFSNHQLKNYDQLWIFSSSRYDARLLSKKDFNAIIQFALDGKGLYLLSDAVAEDAIAVVNPVRRNGLGTFESNAIVSELFNAGIKGNYRGMEVLKFPIPDDEGSNLPDQHPLLADMKQLYEGTTISHITDTDKLVTVVAASDGKPLIAVPANPKLSVVIDCGYSRYVDTNKQKDFPNRVQLILNVAKFLTHKEKP